MPATAPTIDAAARLLAALRPGESVALDALASSHGGARAVELAAMRLRGRGYAVFVLRQPPRSGNKVVRLEA